MYEKMQTIDKIEEYNERNEVIQWQYEKNMEEETQSFNYDMKKMEEETQLFNDDMKRLWRKKCN